MKTKKEYFNEIKSKLASDRDNAPLVSFINREIAKLDKHSADAAEAARQHGAMTDELTDRLQQIFLDTDGSFASENLISLCGPEATQAQISYRCNQLTAQGFLEKSIIYDNKRKLNVYKRKI